MRRVPAHPDTLVCGAPCRLSPSGMSRQSTSGELDVEGPLHVQCEGSPASRSSEPPCCVMQNTC
jgi:hypothetical protein